MSILSRAIALLTCLPCLSQTFVLRQPRGCAALVNHETHVTVDVSVGTPPQLFSVVADTGSNSLIVPSCACRTKGSCDETDRCFTGQGASSSFSVKQGLVQGVTLTFGSGTITTVTASDTVEVGGMSARMEDSVLLMVEKRLRFGGPFEGILGLGLPRPSNSRLPEVASREALMLEASRPPLGKGDVLDQANISRGGFLDRANISRFSMCFNADTDGVLRLGTSLPEKRLGSIGTYHWGLDFKGISVGSSHRPALFCGSETMGKQKSQQETACGVVPDSGSTLIMGPQDQVDFLLDDICDNWERCRNNYTSLLRVAERDQNTVNRGLDSGSLDVEDIDSLDVDIPRKSDLLTEILKDCASWQNEQGLEISAMPSLHFHLGGANGISQTVTIPPVAYVMEQQPDGEERKVCAMMFSGFEYTTSKNGPVWILGTPLFFEYQVGYDLKSSPPSISFLSAQEQPCGSCAQSRQLHAKRHAPRPATMRRVTGPPRRPSAIDPSLPL